MPCVLPSILAIMPGLCPDETVSGHSDPPTIWKLRELDGVPFAAQATLSFPGPARVSGTGPCNTFRATQSLPYPWLDIADIAATRRMCPAYEAETDFFAALEAMTLVEASDEVLLLTTADGREMVFVAQRALMSRP